MTYQSGENKLLGLLRQLLDTRSQVDTPVQSGRYLNLCLHWNTVWGYASPKL